MLTSGTTFLASLTHAAESDFTECYGDSFDVSIKLNAESTQTMEMSLPKSFLWFLNGVDFIGELHEFPCLEEPVLAWGVTGIQLISGVSSTAQNRALSRVIIDGLEDRDSFDFLNEGRGRIVLREGIDLPGGYRRRTHTRSPDHTRTSRLGIFEFPEQHRSPEGARVYWNCSQSTCRVQHGFNGKLFVQFEVRNELEFNVNWVALDRALQNLITSWME